MHTVSWGRISLQKQCLFDTCVGILYLSTAVKLKAQDEHHPVVNCWCRLWKQCEQNSGASQSLRAVPKRLSFKGKKVSCGSKKCPTECSFRCVFQLFSSIKSRYILLCNWYTHLGECIGLFQFLYFSCFFSRDWAWWPHGCFMPTSDYLVIM